jgi:hypothetical protein
VQDEPRRTLLALRAGTRAAHPDARRTAVRIPARLTRIRCELVDHDQYGIEARILHNEEHYVSHSFAPWHCIPFATPQASAINWAEAERKVIETAPRS